MRWSIVRTLLWKEALRFRYNWGLLVMIGGILALAGLVSLGERLGEMPGQTPQIIKVCIIRAYANNDATLRWQSALLQSEPEGTNSRNQVLVAREGDERIAQLRGVRYPENVLYVNLLAPSETNSGSAWKVGYDLNRSAEGELLKFRLWVRQVTQRVMGRPELLEELPSAQEGSALNADEERLPKIMTALVIFAIYLLSFNLYITSTAEEREKKALLAIMLSPARPSEVIGAKVLFYSVASLIVAGGVVALLDFKLLGRPLLWSTIVSGSIAYVSIGTVVLCLVRRQSTINTVSMVYLLAAALVMSLSVFLLPFAILRHMMVENYLFHQLEMIIGARANPLARLYQPLMWGLTVGWFLAAIWVFGRWGVTTGQVRRQN